MRSSRKRLGIFLVLVFLFSMVFGSPALAVSADEVNAVKAEFQETYNILNGKAEADLLIKNIKILDVFQNKVTPGSLLINKGKIIALNPSEQLKAKKVFDGKGMHAIPGLIDAHFHIDSQLASPAAMQKVLVPRGTTTVFAEILDIVSAGQEKGIEAVQGVFKDYEKFPYRLYMLAPGKKVDADIAIKLLDWKPVIGIGELNHNLFLKGNEDELEKLATAYARNMIIDGHIEFDKDDLANLFPAMGATNDHDVFSYEDALKSLNMGLPIQIREGLGCLEPIIPNIVKDKVPTDNVTLATDNISVETLLEKGHMDYIVQKAINMGVTPIEAIKMASYNVARSFKMEDKLGSLTPGRYADIILIEKLDEIKPVYVFKGGELVAEQGKLLKEAKVDYSGVKTNLQPGLMDLTKEDLDIKPEISADGTKAKVKVFVQELTGYDEYGEQWLPVKDGKIVPEYQGKKLVRVSIIERYPKSGKRNIVNGYIAGYDINKGAVGIIMGSPSQHIGVIGNTVDDLFFAAKELDKHTGAYLTAEDGKVKKLFSLPIYSMMTDLEGTELVKQLKQLNQQAQLQGYPQGMPWYTKMNFLFWGLDRREYIF